MNWLSGGKSGSQASLGAANSGASTGNDQEQQMRMLAELEIELTADMYQRMTSACQRKCVPTTYRDSDLSKGEAVCLDRCVAKYLEVHERIGKQLTTMTQRDEEAMKRLQAQGAQLGPQVPPGAPAPAAAAPSLGSLTPSVHK
jgi:import inner membrane translocase subunit TIM10